MINGEKLSDKYAEIVNFDYKGVQHHPHMPNINRAAQFAPFAALEGHMPLMREQERYVGQEQALTDEDISILNERVTLLKEHENENPEIAICYFVPDLRKKGGVYQTDKIRVRFVNISQRFIKAETGYRYRFERIRSIEGEIFLQS